MVVNLELALPGAGLYFFIGQFAVALNGQFGPLVLHREV